MVGRSLKVAICGPAHRATRIAALIEEVVSRQLIDDGPVPSPVVSVVSDLAGEPVSANNHLVVSIGPDRSPWIDVAIAGEAEAEMLAIERLAPWATRWHAGRRAPRAQVAVLAGPDPSWSETAARLIARLRVSTASSPVLRIDHIGSTSVPGLPAKNLIDIQILVPARGDASVVAEAATDAGFVRVSGRWFGLDRQGNRYPEEIVVDADPGRPVNINIRSADAPVARETLLYRDWLRADTEGRDRYAAMKAELAGQHVDDYGRRKEPFISRALGEAERWAAQHGWSLAPRP